MTRANTPADVFKSIDTHDNDTSVCWEWTGTLGGRDGRGYIAIDGRKLLAHRVVYEIFNGELTDRKIVVRHKCDNPLCCNPLHLEPGTRRDNELDKYRRDRSGLSHAIVKFIKQKKYAGWTEQSVVDIVQIKFGLKISCSSVGKIRRGDRRKIA